MTKLSLRDLDLTNKKVLMRVDFNVPLNQEQVIVDDTRMRQALPSIEYVIKQGGKLILMSHLGRPKGKKIPSLSLTPCTNHLKHLLQKEVKQAPDSIGDAVKKMTQALKGGEVMVLENLRFHKGEKEPDQDPSFAKSLAELGEVYVNDAFGTSHRTHASTTHITQYFPKKSAMGFLIEKELSFLSPLILAPKHPFYAVLGGSKVGTKIGALHSLLSKIDAIFIGGGMAFTFLKAQGIEIGDSLCDQPLIEKAKKFFKETEVRGIQLYLPTDFVIASHFANDAKTSIVSAKEGIPPGWRGMDIGPKTIQEWTVPLEKAATLFWNGPMGVFEMPNFAHGTDALTKKLSTLSASVIVGGGDSVAAVTRLNAQENFTHISTGGGASLEYIEHGHLPGIDHLSDK